MLLQCASFQRRMLLELYNPKFRHDKFRQIISLSHQITVECDPQLFLCTEGSAWRVPLVCSRGSSCEAWQS
jgi:hypothetical protein